MIKVPMNSLSVEALQGVIEDYVLREGTDYGHREFSLAEKCRAVERQLADGQAEIWFDPHTRSIDIRPAAAGRPAAAPSIAPPPSGDGAAATGGFEP
jgi:hypothetical protein